MYFGGSCMSCLHDVRRSTDKDTKERTKGTEERERGVLCGLCEPVASLCVLVRISVRNGGDLPRIERLEEPARRLEIELRIGRFDAEEEAVAARQREARHVEDRVVRLRQAVEREHAQHRRERRAENGALERHRHER